MDFLKRRRKLALRGALVASLGVHCALVATAAMLPARAPTVEAAEAVTVDVVEVAAPPEEAAPEAPPPAAASAPRARPTQRTLAAIAPAPEAEPEPTPAPSATVPEEPAEPSASTVAPAGSEAAPGSAVAGAPSAGVAGGVVGGSPGGLGSARAPVAEAQRKVLFARYRELMRGRIGAGFRYPTEARELELEGEVVVEVTVDRRGELRRARLRGSCPHALLCDDALRTVRAAAPFAPLPADLVGEALQIDVPLQYAFE